MATQAKRDIPAYERLMLLMKVGNYDDALTMVSGSDLRSIWAPDDISRLRFRCMISDVWDYGGCYADAKNVLFDGERNEHIGETAKKALRTVRDVHDLRDLAMAKQQCWSLLLWGMTYFRSSYGSSDIAPSQDSTALTPPLDEAMELFQLALKIAQILHESTKIQITGTLARAWYCIGLAHRERRESQKARAAFRRALELTEDGIEERKLNNESTASFEFNMARCTGLGMGWIAYNEARLTEASAALVMARHLMRRVNARMISKYLDTVQATIMMSESAQPGRIREAINLLEDAYSTFVPEKGPGHNHYALRCLNELGLAYLRLAHATIDDKQQYEKNLATARSYVLRVKNPGPQLKKERLSYCLALITEARIQRELGAPDEALKLAEQAKKGDACFLRCLDSY